MKKNKQNKHDEWRDESLDSIYDDADTAFAASIISIVIAIGSIVLAIVLR